MVIVIYKQDVKMWYLSLCGFGISVIPFVLFMFRTNFKYLLFAIATIAAATVFYLIVTKRITHPKYGYTAIQAINFYKKCNEAGFKNITICRNKRKEFEEFSKSFSFTEGLDFNQILELFSTGKKLS